MYIKHTLKYNQNYYLKNKNKIINYGKRDNGLAIVFHGIKARCNYKKHREYKNYGERGIKCLWKSYFDFKNDMYKSYLKHKKINGEKNTQIDRINNSKGYCKENCRWVTKIEQANNTTRTRWIFFNNKKMSIANLARLLNLKYTLLKYRIDTGYSIENTIKKYYN